MQIGINATLTNGVDNIDELFMRYKKKGAFGALYQIAGFLIIFVPSRYDLPNDADGGPTRVLSRARQPLPRVSSGVNAISGSDALFPNI